MKNPQFDHAISLEGIASAFPEKIVENHFFGNSDAEKSEIQKKMFLGTKTRRHMSRGESTLDLFEIASRKLEQETGLDFTKDVDGIMTNVSLPDLAFTGCGAMLAQRLKLKPKMVLDLHNGGCVSFLLLADYAQTLMKAHGVKRMLMGIAQTAAGRIFSHEQTRKKPQSAIPGDGAAIALFTLGGESPITPILQRCHPDFASDMTVTADDEHSYWEPSESPIYLDFPENKIATILMRGNRLVPEAMREVLKLAELKSKQIDGLVTNQPNPFFLRNWRESLELPPEKHFETFEEFGNLFQAGIPISLDAALRKDAIKAGNRIMLAGFSHAGDYSAAGILNYKVNT